MTTPMFILLLVMYAGQPGEMKAVQQSTDFFSSMQDCREAMHWHVERSPHLYWAATCQRLKEKPKK